MTTTKPFQRLGFIDSLRGFAALYIILFHMVITPAFKATYPNWFRPFILSGFTGVTLFFIISAFTLCLTLQFQQEEKNYLTNFYLRRIFRIVPLYYLWLIFALFTGTGIGFNGFVNQKYNIILCSIFGYNLLPGHQEGIVLASWTLGVEMVFYFFFPFIFKFVRSLNRSFIFLLIALVIAFAHYGAVTYLEKVNVIDRYKYFIYFSVLDQLPVFAIGIITYYLYLKLKARQNVSDNLGFILLISGILFYLLQAYLLHPYSSGLDFVMIYPISFAYMLIILGLSVIPVKLIVNKVSIFFGAISYSLYLNHSSIVIRMSPLYKCCYSLNLNRMVALVLCYLLTLVPVTIISYISFKLIETSGINFGKRLISKLALKAAYQRVVR